MPRTSIALAIFNGEKYLGPQLESLARQTTLPSELVIADDSSDDRSLDIVREFAKTAPFPVRLTRNETRLGYSANFMQAAALCGSDLIAYCDQDDIWEPDKIAVMEQVFDDPDVLLAYHNATLIDADGSAAGKLYRGTADIVKFAPLSRNPWIVIPGFTQVFRRDLIRFSPLHPSSCDVDWLGESLPHDRWFHFLASVLGCVAFVRQPLVRYRQHGENTFGHYTDRRAHIDRLLRGEHFIRAAAAAAKNRSELLQRMQGELTAEWRERALKGIVYYDELQRRLDDRTAVYATPSYWARVKAMWALFRRGAYGKAHGSSRFGWSDLLMDTYIAVPLGPRLRRLLRK